MKLYFPASDSGFEDFTHLSLPSQGLQTPELIQYLFATICLFFRWEFFSKVIST